MNQTIYTLSPGFDTTAFMRDDWGKRPRLIRNAFDFSSGVPVPAAEVLALALNPNTQCKLISQTDGKWRLKRNPLTALPKATAPNWTVLVQNLECHAPAAAALLKQFAFASYAELDDLMASVATTGGGVGAHVDSYDVFLLQAAGQRRWRISQQNDLSLVPKLQLKILQHFAPEQEWVLNPGDMLYLPPNVAHEGVAVGIDGTTECMTECMTYSIGYRAPQLHDVVDDLLGMLAGDDGEDTSPQLKLPAAKLAPASLGVADVATYREALNNWLNDATLEEHLGCVLTRPNREHATANPRAKLKVGQGIALSAGARMLYSAGFVFIEGFAFAASGADHAVLAALANQRNLAASEWAKLSADAQAIVTDWLQEGWLVNNATTKV